MKIVLYLWGGYNESILNDNLIELGHEVIPFFMKCNHYTRDMEFASKLIEIIRHNRADAVLSFNYYPIISLVCDTTSVRYYSWVYDSPHLTLFAKTVDLPCNRIGVFDRSIVNDLVERNVGTVFHLPIGGSAALFSKTINNASSQKCRKYSADVSFVGQLYNGKKNHFEKIYNEESKEYQAILEQCFNYSDDIVAARIIDGTIDFEKAYTEMSKLGLLLGDDYFAEPADIVIPELFDKEVTALERKILVGELSQISNIDFKLYTSSSTSVRNHGVVDYMEEMPVVFANSKININITLRSIRSGIPLRALDILSCGGFLLSNYQPEIAEFFVEDSEVVFFRSLEECIDKVNYYLLHDEQRVGIAQAGAVAVKARMSYKKALNKLLEI